MLFSFKRNLSFHLALYHTLSVLFLHESSTSLHDHWPRYCEATGNDDIIELARIINEPRKYLSHSRLPCGLNFPATFFLLFIRRELRRRVKRTGPSPTSSSFVRRDWSAGGFCGASCTNCQISCHVFHDVTPKHEGKRGTSRARHKCFRGDLHSRRHDRARNDLA